MDDPLPSILLVGFIFVLIVLNGFFVSVEFAMVKIRSSRLDTLVDEGRRNARTARRILNNLEGYLSACQLGITFCSLGLGWLGGPYVASLLTPLFHGLGWTGSSAHAVALLIAFLLITTLHIVFGELAPKTIAIRKSENVTLVLARPLSFFYKLMYPFIWILNNLANGILRLLGIAPTSEQDHLHTEEEIRVLMKESHESGLIDSSDLTLVDNIFEFTDTTAREIMIPRTEMICLYSQNTLEENLEIALEGMRTRYPVCDNDKDHIIGFIHIKDLIRTGSSDYRDYLRPMITVPDSIQIHDLMKRMQRGKTQIALLIDEYGGTSGIVTLEDIVEQIVGEIQDEFDEERPGFEQSGENSYSIDGLMLIEAVNDRFGLEMDSEDYDTIGGWLYSRIEVLPPKVGQSVEFAEFFFIVEETEQKRISRVKLIKQQVIPLDLLDTGA
ncbi:CBS domain containing-hemolysin-like protein [Paenibacillus shirakamiensis]|uniref:CBS domain containing-hemolysin-like protein n=1 Tax=Paenibacillus shirakamiensis TaxID=1265935 RepID=A0ABS4JDR4_9BACL|nr:hemolysin family protein [Paenibacillus shirakamiensis]MBP1999862.1 CBS domain containing-hemolysin-like protein [Paenibacillus shirakamiensis]